MIQKIKRYMDTHNMIEKGDRIVLGVSGGADSVALFMVLCGMAEELELSLSVVHVNHGIRSEAGEDAAYVKRLCEEAGISCDIYEADIPAMAKAEKKSEEEMGRDYRYRCFAETAARIGAHKIAVAHHRNDQAETVLFHLIRGTDVRGMTGIAPVTRRDGYILIRPLLAVEKMEIENFLTERGISWCQDVTNGDFAYARNLIRGRVIPDLEGINDKAVAHIADFADAMSEYEAFFDRQTERFIAEQVVFGEETVLDRERLLLVEKIFADRILYEILCRMAGSKRDIRREHVSAVYELLSNTSGRQVVLPYGLRAKNVYEKLVIRKSLDEDDREPEGITYVEEYTPDAGQSVCVEICGMGSVIMECVNISDLLTEEKKNLLADAGNSKNNYTKYFDCATIKGTLRVRTPKPDDYMVIDKQGNTKKLSRHFIDIKLPADLRRRQPLLAADSEILWVLGGRRCERYMVTESTDCILKVTYKGERDGAD